MFTLSIISTQLIISKPPTAHKQQLDGAAPAAQVTKPCSGYQTKLAIQTKPQHHPGILHRNVPTLVAGDSVQL
jgi:hypothetical protein